MARPRFSTRPLSTRATFWASASVLALALWSSGAPSVLYPIYAEQWQLTPVVVTSVFATYQLSLIVALPLLGNLSDVFGRRRIMILGVGLIAASAVVFAVAPHVSFLYLGRLLQGLGAGLGMGAATASLIENNTSSNTRLPASVATISTAAGLTCALLLSGLFAHFLPLPLVWSYLVLLVLALISIAALIATPRDRPTAAGRWRPQKPSLPSDIRLVFWISAFAVALAYCVGAIFLSLGAHMIDQFTDTNNTVVVGSLLALSSACIGITALLLTGIPATNQVFYGLILTLASLAIMGAASVAGSIALFLGWCVIGGVAYSFTFSGGLGMINAVGSAHQRGATLSLLYLVAYALQAGTAIGVGAVATTSTLSTAVIVAALTLACLCLIVFGLLFAQRRQVSAHGSVVGQ